MHAYYFVLDVLLVLTETPVPGAIIPRRAWFRMIGYPGKQAKTLFICSLLRVV